MNWLTDNRLALLVFALLSFGLVFGPPLDAYVFGPKAAMTPLPPVVGNILSAIAGSIATFLTGSNRPPQNPTPVASARSTNMDFIQTVEADAVKGWDEFLAGVHWLKDEAAKVRAAVEKLDPAVQATAQAVITDAEAAAGALAAKGVTVFTNAESAAIADAETLLANFANAAAGKSVIGQEASSLFVGAIQRGGDLLAHIAPIIVTRLLAQLGAAVVGA